jgi:pilus assembly protein TadC
MKLELLFSRIGQAVPLKSLRFLQDRINKAGLSEDAAAWVGKRIVASFFVAAACGAIPFAASAMLLATPIVDFSTLPAPLLFAAAAVMFLFGFLLPLFVSYMIVYYVIVDRAERAERMLPEFLLIVSSNLRAGMTPFNAFKRSAIAELGPLEKEIQLATVKASASQSLTKALLSLSDRLDSEVLDRTVKLFDKSVRSGGRIADLLSAISEEVRRQQELKAELITATQSYTMFLFFIIVFISPALLSVSAQFLSIYANIRGQFNAEQMEGYSLPFFSGQIQINTEFAIRISYLTLIGTSLLSSLLMGIISRGKPLYGIKYFPLLAAGSLISYNIGMSMASGIFSSF